MNAPYLRLWREWMPLFWVECIRNAWQTSQERTYRTPRVKASWRN